MMEVEGGADMEGSMMEGDGNTMTSLEGIVLLFSFISIDFFVLINNMFTSYLDDVEDSIQTAPRVRRSARVAKAQDTSKDVANCFGFDDDDDEDEDED
jgi:hypothetical protein